MHGDNPNNATGGDAPLITYRGHTLTIDEGHALVYGLFGLFIGEHGNVLKTVLKEFQYFIASFILSYLVGKLISR